MKRATPEEKAQLLLTVANLQTGEEFSMGRDVIIKKSAGRWWTRQGTGGVQFSRTPQRAIEKAKWLWNQADVG
jgi:hypothetical protein